MDGDTKVDSASQILIESTVSDTIVRKQLLNLPLTCNSLLMTIIICFETVHTADIK